MIRLDCMTKYSKNRANLEKNFLTNNKATPWIANMEQAEKTAPMN